MILKCFSKCIIISYDVRECFETDQNGPHVDMDFYIKATPETIDFVNSGKLRDAVFDYLDSDHDNGIPTQARTLFLGGSCFV